MDHANLFFTTTTARLLRLEFGLVMVVSAGALLLHWREVNWLNVALLFAYIDVIGYLPGAMAHRRRGPQAVGRAYYVLYNTMHSFIAGGLVALAWWFFLGPEWALLAIPLHLSGDRALFGNYYKSFKVDFEPDLHPAFERFQLEIVSTGRSPDMVASRSSGSLREPVA